MAEQSLFFQTYTQNTGAVESANIRKIENSLLQNINNASSYVEVSPSFNFSHAFFKMNVNHAYISDMAMSFKKYIHCVLPEIEASIHHQDKVTLAKLTNSIICIFAYLYAYKGLSLAIELDKAINREDYQYSEKIYSLLEMETHKIDASIQNADL